MSPLINLVNLGKRGKFQAENVINSSHLEKRKPGPDGCVLSSLQVYHRVDPP